MPSTSHEHHRAADFATPGALPHHAPDLPLEPVHLHLRVHVQIEARRVSGEVTHTVQARTEGAQDLVLHAVGLEIGLVEDPDGGALTSRYDGEKLTIRWADGTPRDATRRVRVAFVADRPITGMMFSSDPAVPWAATDHETERARYWLPCVDHPSVRTTLDLTVRAASGLTILANGLLLGDEAHDDGTHSARWFLEERCPAYLLCLAVGAFVRAEGGRVGGREIAFFAPAPYTEADLQRSFGPTASMMEWMEERLRTPFPYPKYFQFAAPGIGGAMENISLVSWDAAWVADPLFRAEYGWLLDLVNLHEMSHSYFGDAVVCRDFSHTWLKESWATYMESVWLESVQGAHARDFQLHEERVAYFDEADTRYARPIVTRQFDSSWDMFDRHLYPGGAVRLHALRRLLGDEDFWAGVATYLQRYSGELAETDDFRRILEEQSGRSLTRFFDQWLRSPGYPKLDVAYSHDAKRGVVTLVIEQKQVDAGKGIGLFDLPLIVALQGDDGSWTRQQIAIEAARTSVSIPVSAAPRQVVLDPDGDLVIGLTFQPGDDLLLATLHSGPSMAARIQAVLALAGKPTRKRIAALEAASLVAPFWGLRLIIARALGGVGTRDAAEALARLLLAEQDPQVMGTVASACGKLREPVVQEALRAWIARPERPHRAMGAALVALGAQRGDEANSAAILDAHAGDDPWWGWQQRGALLGLAQQRSESGRARIQGQLAGADKAQVRAVAADALATSARFGDAAARREAVDALVDATRDRNYGVRLAAVYALSALGEPAGLAAITQAESGFADQDLARVRRAAATLAAARGGKTATAKLEKRVEELSDQLRTLRGKVEDLEAKGEK